MSHTLKLTGCTPEPLSHYLKALGVLRILSEQRTANLYGFWQDDLFCLETDLTREQILDFFLYDYHPTPFVSPWNGSTGFYPKDKAQQKLLNAFCQSKSSRFAAYQKTIPVGREQVGEMAKQPSAGEKSSFLTELRNKVPDSALPWLDACALVTPDQAQFPPLLGTGGNDGNFEFGRTTMQQLQVVFQVETGKPQTGADHLLRAALFAEVLPNLNYNGVIGQFNPIAAGGANAVPGFVGNPRVNPWDFILMLEGALMFMAGVTRRYEQDGSGGLSYPFTVRSSTVGYGSAAPDDKARGEMWLPLWSKGASHRELQSLFREGRAKFNQRMAVDGVDFACAIAQLGIHRNLTEFVRYSFQERNGLSYFAIPLGRFKVQRNVQVDRLAPLTSWLKQLKRLANSDQAPASLQRVHRRLQTQILQLTQSSEEQRRGNLLEVLICLGEVEATLDRAFRTKEAKDKPLKPLVIGNADQGRKDADQWLKECRQDSPEFRLALALVGQNLRERLVWVRGQRWIEHDDKRTTWQNGANLEQNLIQWLQRLEIEEQQKNKSEEGEDSGKIQRPSPERQKPTASLDDVMAWLNGEVDDQRLEAIARGLSLLDCQNAENPCSERLSPIPASYALLKVVHHRPRLSQKQTSAQHPSRLPVVPGLLRKLAAGDSTRAIEAAARRLQGSGIKPFTRQGFGIVNPRRLAAALAFPLADNDIDYLLSLIQDKSKEEQ
ncbi:type I-U CRISPR-associated protein Csx17 [Spirulina subsalsa]|uniref:type I-G CRISPR-associated protein Cas8g1/Csx17 n=1 Tax=Spirulina subsalsa TaxID=54311 RepID=UPI0002DB6275|nr:type I-U CRISPR-associated protein Csx17 [Spirulina subsalsa]